MPRIGHRAAWLLAGALAAGIPALWMWGFTVDDALISVRYARHLAAGQGWRFNATGTTTDGVTPLPWPPVLAMLGGADALATLGRAKALGFILWTAAGGALGAAIESRRPKPAWPAAAALACVALSVPLAAHAVSGMETALATSLATTAALLSHRPRAASLTAGLAASLRPEMLPWAATVSLAAAWLHVDEGTLDTRMREAARCWLLASAPFGTCVALRLLVWRAPAPLALLAKPGDLQQGLAYAMASCVVTIVPLLALAPFALRRAPQALTLIVAFAVHVVAVAVVGGDWMPYARLMVPVVPSVAWAAVLLGERAHPLASGGRAVMALGMGAFLLVRSGMPGRAVMADRGALVKAARPLLVGARCVAALDVGWLGAATEAEIVDLAGVTDPEVAALPGGHTSKRVSGLYLVSRHADRVLLYTPQGLPGDDLARWRDSRWGRVVEARLAADETVARHFEAIAWLALGNRGAGYVVLRAVP